MIVEQLDGSVPHEMERVLCHRLVSYTNTILDARILMAGAFTDKVSGTVSQDLGPARHFARLLNFVMWDLG